MTPAAEEELDEDYVFQPGDRVILQLTGEMTGGQMPDWDEELTQYDVLGKVAVVVKVDADAPDDPIPYFVRCNETNQRFWVNEANIRHEFYYDEDGYPMPPAPGSGTNDS